MADIESNPREGKNVEEEVEFEFETDNESTDPATDPAKTAVSTSQGAKRRGRKLKRKADTDLQKANLKRQNSLPRAPPSSNLPMTFSEMVLKSFEDGNFVRKLAPAITNIINPTLIKAMEGTVERAVESAIESAVEKMKTLILDPIVKSNNDLSVSLQKQADIIEAQNQKIDSQQHLLTENAKQISSLEKDIKSMQLEIEKLQQHTNDAEQYGRRNSIRLINFTSNTAASEYENIRSTVDFINTNLLSDSEKISSSDIERCHPVGRKPVGGSKGQMIVKFAKYLTKQRVYSAKTKLKNNPGRIFMTEDLTKANHLIVQSLIPLRKSRKIFSFWTRNGTIFVKHRSESIPLKVRSVSEAKNLFE